MPLHPTFARLLPTLPPRSATEPALPMAPERRSALARAQSAIPELLVADEGATVHVGELSPGCRLCQEGGWVCVFLTYRCAARCPFSSAPASPPPAPWSDLGAEPAALVARMPALGVRGVGFSGGDPLLEPDLLCAWVRELRAAQPGAYLWCYTSGLSASPGLMRRLQAAGLDELRFNLAATGYREPAVWAALRDACALLSRVTVEIPMLPGDVGQVKELLPRLVTEGVRHLVVHELALKPAAPDARSFALPSGEVLHVHPESAAAALDVLAAAAALGASLGASFCSVESKALQLRGRLRTMARPLARAYDEVTADGLLESLWLVPRDATTAEDGARAGLFVHPTEARAFDRARYAAALVRLRPALVFGEAPTLVAVEPIAD